MNIVAADNWVMVRQIPNDFGKTLGGQGEPMGSMESGVASWFGTNATVKGFAGGKYFACRNCDGLT